MRYSRRQTFNQIREAIAHELEGGGAGSAPAPAAAAPALTSREVAALNYDLTSAAVGLRDPSAVPLDQVVDLARRHADLTWVEFVDPHGHRRGTAEMPDVEAVVDRLTALAKPAPIRDWVARDAGGDVVYRYSAVKPE